MKNSKHHKGKIGTLGEIIKGAKPSVREAFESRFNKTPQPANDGITHLNIYLYAKTAIGRILSKGDAKLQHPVLGSFDCVDAFMLYINSPKPSDTMRFLNHVVARKRRANQKQHLVKNYVDFTYDALLCMFQSNPRLRKLLVESTLPFDSYYQRNELPMRSHFGIKIVSMVEELRNDLKAGTAAMRCDYTEILERVRKNTEAVVEVSDKEVKQVAKKARNKAKEIVAEIAVAETVEKPNKWMKQDVEKDELYYHLKAAIEYWKALEPELSDDLVLEVTDRVYNLLLKVKEADQGYYDYFMAYDYPDGVTALEAYVGNVLTNETTLKLIREFDTNPEYLTLFLEAVKELKERNEDEAESPEDFVPEVAVEEPSYEMEDILPNVEGEDEESSSQ